VKPHADFSGIIAALAIVVVANVAYETALVFSNAMLPDLAPVSVMGRISGWAWASGYVGGIICLFLALVLLVGIGDIKPLLSLPQDQAQNVRAVAPLTALWFFVLSLPLAFFCADAPRTGISLRQAIKQGVSQLAQTLTHLKNQKNLTLYLCGSALYRDGLNTLFAMGGLFAAAAFGMNFTDILIFAIGLNVTAGIGAALFAFADDAWGSKRTIMISLAGLIITGTVILLLHDKTSFIAASLVLGIFIGPAQAASRTLAARLSPPDMMAQTYGFYALTGRVVSFFGPLVFAVATSLLGNIRFGFVTIILFWVAGMVFLAFVREDRNT